MKKILAIDIGGTNSRFGSFAVDESGRLLKQTALWLSTKDADSFGTLVKELRSSGFPLAPEDADCVVIAIAGPVEGGVYSNPPLIGWDLHLNDAVKALVNTNIFLINDFLAQAHACRTEAVADARPILEGTPDRSAATAVIGAGTGLGMAALVPDGSGGFIAVPSEGGHTDFPFIGDAEHRYARFLLDRLGEEGITGNVVVSGRGLSLLHEFHTGVSLAPDAVGAELKDGSATLLWAARFYGRACRNYALKVLALGGLYIAGGVAAKVPALVENGAFGAEFRRSAMMGHLMKRIPVFLVTNEESGIWGAAGFGMQHLRTSGKTA